MYARAALPRGCAHGKDVSLMLLYTGDSVAVACFTTVLLNKYELPVFDKFTYSFGGNDLVD
jgi:hypothetical protein